MLDALVGSGKFKITILSRSPSENRFPASITVLPVDYNSIESLTAALKDQDAVVSTIGMEGILGQTLIFDAAIAAGVKRFLPSEFGSDISNSKTAALPVYEHKVAVRKHIEKKVKNGADITYTYVINGTFLDWGIEVGFLVNWKEGKPRIFNGGNRPISTTTLGSVGLAVVGVLSEPEDTKNRSVFVHDIVITQNRLMELAKSVQPTKEWDPVEDDVVEVEKIANKKLANGQADMELMYEYLYVAVFGEGYGAKMENVDNKLLGVPGKTEADIKAIWEKLLV